MNKILLSVAICIFFLQFLYSGIMKIKKYPKKTAILQRKINSTAWSNIGMICVILLEILASLYLVFYLSIYPFIKKEKKNKTQRNILRSLAITCVVLFLIFMVTVTILYHPPAKTLIPFLSNLTTFGAFMIILGIVIQGDI